MSNRIQIGLYLALVTAASAVFNVLIIQGGGMANEATHKWIYAIMWAPGVAAILTTLIATRSLKGLGWLPWPPGQLLIGWGVPVAYAVLTILGAIALGAGALNIAGWSDAASMMGLDVGPWVGLAAFAAFGTPTGLLSATGEEIGWRGFLTSALGREMGF